jgi:hypothetical protein
VTRASDLAQLTALRALREERARTAVAVEAARLRASEHLAAEADAAIIAHDAETDERERKFFEAMGLRPVSEKELGRAQNRLVLSDHRREALNGERAAATAASAENEERLETARGKWRQRLHALDKLRDAQARLGQAEQIDAEAAAEAETEDMSAERARSSC